MFINKKHSLININVFIISSADKKLIVIKIFYESNNNFIYILYNFNHF